MQRLSRKRKRDQAHQPLLGGRAAAAAFNPVELIEQILRSIRDQADAEDREAQGIENALLVQSWENAGSSRDTPATIEARIKEQDLDHKVSTAKVTLKYKNGKSQAIDLKWRDVYRDEYTNDPLPLNHIKEAMLDEIKLLCDEVVEAVDVDEALKDPDHVLISGRWINHNKGDSDQPRCRGRYVGQEVNAGGEADAACYAATPPLDAKRTLFSRMASERRRGNKPLKLHFLDVRKAYFNGVPRRSI